MSELGGNFRPERLGDSADAFKWKHGRIVMNTQLSARAVLRITNVGAFDAFTRFQALGEPPYTCVTCVRYLGEEEREVEAKSFSHG
jgi:hypothetical protein